MTKAFSWSRDKVQLEDFNLDVVLYNLSGSIEDSGTFEILKKFVPAAGQRITVTSRMREEVAL